MCCITTSLSLSNGAKTFYILTPLWQNGFTDFVIPARDGQKLQQQKTSFFVHFPAACKVRSHKTRRDDTGGRAIIASLPDKQQLIVLATYKAKQLNIRSVAADVEAFLFLDRPCSVVDDLKESI